MLLKAVIDYSYRHKYISLSIIVKVVSNNVNKTQNLFLLPQPINQYFYCWITSKFPYSVKYFNNP